MMGVTPPARELFTHPQILSAGESRINRQSPFTAMITAVVILTVIQKVFWGPLANHCENFPDLQHNERLALAPVIALMLLVGLVPSLIVDSVNPTVLNLLAHWRF